MQSWLFQILIPFILSGFVVILITVIAERFGTKVGGIFGTLPSTLVIALIFIAVNRGTDFASEAAVVIPAELGINVIFLLVFALLVHRSISLAWVATFTIWGFLSSMLVLFNLNSIGISVLLYFFAIIGAFFILEFLKKNSIVRKCYGEVYDKKNCFSRIASWFFYRSSSFPIKFRLDY